MAAQILPGASAVSQGLSGFLNACGEAAAAVVASIQRVAPNTPATVAAMVRDQTAAGLADNGGVSTLAGNSWELQRLGVPNQVTPDVWGALGQVGQRPVEVLFQNAGALPGNPPDLRGHFETFVGFDPSSGRYIASNSIGADAAAGKLSQYSPQDIANADPVGAILPTNPVPGIADNVGQTVQRVTGGATSSAQEVGSGLAAGLLAPFTGDFAWRAALIVIGGILILVGLIALTMPSAPTREAIISKALPAAMAA